MDFASGEVLQEEMERARSFAKEGRFEEALKSYMRVFEDGRQYSPFVGVRLSYCLSETVELGRVYEPAMEKLIELRNAHETSMCSGDYNLFSLQEWDALNQHIDVSHQIKFYDSLKQDPRKNDALMQAVRHVIWLKLIDMKRYHELSAVELAQKLSENSMMAFIQLSPDGLMNKMFAAKNESASLKEHSLKSLLMHAGAIYECALGIKKQSLAKKAYELIMQYQKTGRGYAALITHASRAGATTRAQKLLTEAKTRLSESQLQVIRDLQKKLNL
ncbi:MAG: hypothetical protein C0508_05130 [Cyanobacteria bacterium PR.023]|nr:hypothetical protein [Cyanobacteria bacterium PR.3.49]MBA4074405.1 hypothetical protein [Cyanobacteria bacterium PR.023]